jgi:hypothetical protein
MKIPESLSFTNNLKKCATASDEPSNEDEVVLEESEGNVV